MEKSFKNTQSPKNMPKMSGKFLKKKKKSQKHFLKKLKGSCKIFFKYL